MSSNPIIVTVCGDTVDEVREKLVKLAEQFGYEPKQEALPLVLPNHSAPAEKKEEAPAEKKEDPHVTEMKAPGTRGRHPKECACDKCAAKKAPLEIPAVQEKVEAPVSPAIPSSTNEKVEAPSKEVVMEKMQGILSSGPNKELNLGKLKAILSNFGATKFSELKEEHFAAFVAECDKRLAA